MVQVLSRWQPVDTSNLGLALNTVHVWRLRLDQPVPIGRLEKTLSPDECLRADSFVLEKLRRRFIVSRGLLRLVLSRYLAEEPARLRFRYLPEGKPVLADGGVEFNLSHSSSLALLAVSRNLQLGVDLEKVRPMGALDGIVYRFFAAQERSLFESLPHKDRERAFFNGWTRKEAYLKARGVGLAESLDHFEVSLRPGEPAGLLAVNGSREEASQWSIRDLDPDPGFVAAVAVRARTWSLQCLQWV